MSGSLATGFLRPYLLPLYKMVSSVLSRFIWSGLVSSTLAHLFYCCSDSSLLLLCFSSRLKLCFWRLSFWLRLLLLGLPDSGSFVLQTRTLIVNWYFLRMSCNEELIASVLVLDWCPHCNSHESVCFVVGCNVLRVGGINSEDFRLQFIVECAL